MAHSEAETLLAVLRELDLRPTKRPDQQSPDQPTDQDDEDNAANEQPPPIVQAPAPSVHVHDLSSRLSMDHDEAAQGFPFDSRKGQPSPNDMRFVPFIAVTKYCYKFVPAQWMQPLATRFFDQDKIYTRPWDLYYVHTDAFGAIAFVSEQALQSLVEEINHAFPGASIVIAEDIIIDFSDLCQELRPRWLGRSELRPQYNAWLGRIQLENAVPAPRPSDPSHEAFRDKMETALEANKNKKNKTGKAKRHDQNVATRQSTVKETILVQRYLGLLPSGGERASPERASADNTSSQPPYPCDKEPVFISIDCEAWEKPPRMVTEVGVATLDTRDLIGSSPGSNGEEWHGFIRSRHFRISEYRSYINEDFVQGCPDHFEFGRSEFVSKADIASALTGCFHAPFSKQMPVPSGSESETATVDQHAGGEKKAAEEDTEEEERRNIILIGHDLAQDIDYCHELGFSPLHRGNLLDTLDTVRLYRALHTHEAGASSVANGGPSSLARVLCDLDLTGWHLHNAGNDATYTLQALLAIAVRSAHKGHSEQEGVDDAATATTGSELVSAPHHDLSVSTTMFSTGQNGSARPFSPSGLYTLGGVPLGKILLPSLPM